MEKSKLRLRLKILTNVFYGIGASVILIAIMLKILHIKIAGISTDILLGAGFVVEAVIFAVYGFSVRGIIDEHNRSESEMKSHRSTQPIVLDFELTESLSKEIKGFTEDFAGAREELKGLKNHMNNMNKLFK